jgi:hypothetical protein
MRSTVSIGAYLTLRANVLRHQLSWAIPAEEVSKLQASITATKATDCKRPKSEACKLADMDERTTTARLSDAKAKD